MRGWDSRLLPQVVCGLSRPENDSDVRPDRDHVALGGANRGERPVRRRLDFDRDLVRLDLEQRLAFRDEIALAPQPT